MESSAMDTFSPINKHLIDLDKWTEKKESENVKEVDQNVSSNFTRAEMKEVVQEDNQFTREDLKRLEDVTDRLENMVKTHLTIEDQEMKVISRE